MTPIFLASVTAFVGKNVVAVGLAEKFRREGKSVGYFKPIGPLAVRAEEGMVDEDALFFRKVLKLSEPISTICPVVLSDQTIADLLRGGLKNVRERILSAYQEASKGKDVMVIAGMGRLSAGLSLGYSMDAFVRDVNARLLVVERYHWPTETFDGIEHMRALAPENMAGVVFNLIAPAMVNHIGRAVTPFLHAHGVEVFGAVPVDPVLNAVAVKDLVGALGGKVLVGDDKLDLLVEHFSIGAMQADAALRFFQSVPHKAVITGGDRADIQLAALQTSTRCLILTGDLYPNDRILARAEEAGVPVLLVPQETSEAITICERLHGQLSLHSDRKIDRARELVEKALDWPKLLDALKMK